MKTHLVVVDVALHAEDARRVFAGFDTRSVFHLLVPTRPLSVEESQFVRSEETVSQQIESPEMVMANWRLRDATGALQGAGFDHVTGEITTTDPLARVTSVFDDGGYDEVVIVTKPAGLAGLVHMDLFSRIKRHVDCPVTHLEVGRRVHAHS